MTARRYPRSLHAVEPLQALTEAEQHLLRSLTLEGTLEVGTKLQVSGRPLRVEGFDPANASGRRIYLYDESALLAFAVDLEDVLP